MKHLDLFSGIGGFAIAVDSVWPQSEHIFCDNDKFCQAVLKKHWPNAKIYGDIRTITNTGYFGQTEPEKQAVGSKQPHSIDFLTGGFPCQPFSQAGRRKGTADDRYLWPEMFRVIREFKPTWVIAENVRGLVTWNEGLVLEQVCTDLESEGYEVQPLIIPAVAVNAPHRRDRVWFIAHRTGEGRTGNGLEGQGRLGQRSGAGEGKEQSSAGHLPDWNQNWIEVATEFCSVDDGLPAELGDFACSKAQHRDGQLKAYGNAIVPQVAAQIMQSIAYNQ